MLHLPSFLASRPGKQSACQPDGKTLHLGKLHRFGTSVKKDAAKGKTPSVLLIKTSFLGKEYLSVNTPRSAKAFAKAQEKSNRWVLNTLNEFVGDLPYPTEVNEAKQLIEATVATQGLSFEDPKVLSALAVLSGFQACNVSAQLGVDFDSALRHKLKGLGASGLAEKITPHTRIDKLAAQIRSLPASQRKSLRAFLLQAAGSGKSGLAIPARQLMAALKWMPKVAPKATPHATHATRMDTPDELPVTFDSSEPLGRGFAIAFNGSLADVGIHCFPAIDGDTTVNELAHHIQSLPQEQQLALGSKLQTAVTTNKPGFADIAKRLLTTLDWPLPADPEPVPQAPQQPVALIDAPVHVAPGKNAIGWRLANALQDLGLPALSKLTAGTTAQELAQLLGSMPEDDNATARARLALIQENAHGPDAETAGQVLSHLPPAPLPAQALAQGVPVQPQPVQASADAAAVPRAKEERLDFHTAQGLNQALRQADVEFPELTMRTSVQQLIELLKQRPQATPVVLAHLAVLPNHPVVSKSFVELSARIRAEAV